MIATSKADVIAATVDDIRGRLATGSLSDRGALTLLFAVEQVAERVSRGDPAGPIDADELATLLPGDTARAVRTRLARYAEDDTISYIDSTAAKIDGKAVLQIAVLLEHPTVVPITHPTTA